VNYALPLFAYGTLMFPDVIGAVIGRTPEGHQASAQGFLRLEVAGQTFPGLIADRSAPDNAVNGILYPNLSAREWQLLNAFEDGFYVLSEIVVAANGTETLALAYLVPESSRHVLGDAPWNEALFREKHLEGFVSGR
jgi:gamma-glutamylcyclotransferase (GGCT)/AIG2-like uncharacterized protein YtfP